MRKNEILPYAATLMDLGNIVISKVSQRKINTISIIYGIYFSLPLYNHKGFDLGHT